MEQIPKNTQKFSELNFENNAFNNLKIEQNPQNEVHKVNGFHYSKTKTTPLKDPEIISVSQNASQLLDLNYKKIFEEPDFLIGNKIPKKSQVPPII